MWRGHSWMKRLSIMDSIASLFFSKSRIRSALQKTGFLAGFFVPLFLLSISASATTFGPVPVVQQAENSQYFVQGRVLGASWMEMEPRVSRPYTYWRIKVESQPIGAPLGEVVVVRQPGGEIGDMGYNVAGAATFNGGEEVFVALHDTDQHQSIKEVVGLASGKYRVEKTTNGETVLINGLGLPVTGGNGELLGPEEFTKLLKRVAKNESTDADKNVFVNRTPTSQHPQSEMEKKREEEASRLAASQRLDSTNTQGGKGGNPPAVTNGNSQNEIQERAPSSEESSTGSSVGIWVLAAVLLLALAGIFALIVRR